MSRASFLAVVLVFSSGCLFDTSADVPFSALDAAVPDATIPTPDAEPTPDAGGANDGGNSVDFGSPDLTSGGVCPATPDPQGMPRCNPVTRDGCGPVEICDIGLDTATRPPTFFFECRDPRAKELVGGESGDNCDSGDPCRWGHRCVQGECYAYCQFDDGLGCDDTEFCDVFFNEEQITHFGLCVSMCGDLRNP